MCGHHPLHHMYIHPDDHRQMETQATVPSAVITRPCPQCQRPVQEDFVFCPHCGTDLLSACPVCHRAVHADWTHCAFCGTDLLAGKPDVSTYSH